MCEYVCVWMCVCRERHRETDWKRQRKKEKKTETESCSALCPAPRRPECLNSEKRGVPERRCLQSNQTGQLGATDLSRELVTLVCFYCSTWKKNQGSFSPSPWYHPISLGKSGGGCMRDICISFGEGVYFSKSFSCPWSQQTCLGSRSCCNQMPWLLILVSRKVKTIGDSREQRSFSAVALSLRNAVTP